MTVTTILHAVHLIAHQSQVQHLCINALAIPLLRIASFIPGNTGIENVYRKREPRNVIPSNIPLFLTGGARELRFSCIITV